MLVSIIIGGFIATGILDLVLRKKFKIKKNERFMDQFVNKKFFLFELFLYIMFLASVSMRGMEGKYLYIMLFLFFSVVFVLRAFAEYVFRKEERKYIISFAYLAVCLLCALFILLLM